MCVYALTPILLLLPPYTCSTRLPTARLVVSPADPAVLLMPLLENAVRFALEFVLLVLLLLLLLLVISEVMAISECGRPEVEEDDVEVEDSGGVSSRIRFLQVGQLAFTRNHSSKHCKI